MNCWQCGQPVIYLKRWNALKVVACDPKPDEYSRESFVEVEQDVFVSVVRHECPETEPKPKYEYVPINRVFGKGKPRRKKRDEQPSLDV